MDFLSRLNFALISDIADSRPSADHSIEQYLMTKESLYAQLNACKEFFTHRKVFFMGDDDHISLLASYFFNTDAIIVEFDQRIITNQKKWEKELSLTTHRLIHGDIRDIEVFSQLGNFDGFVINPPYGSKNQAYGIKVWLSRSLQLLKPGAIGLIILPINFDLAWSIRNMHIVQQFITQNNCIIIKIDNDLHTYEDLPDPNLRSSNIWISYQGNATQLVTNIAKDGSLYR